MATTPTPPGATPPRPTHANDPQRGDHMNPYGRLRGATTTYWVVGAIVVAILVIGFFLMRPTPAVPPASQTTGETTPPEPATTAPTVPVTPTQPELTAPTQP